MTTWIDTHCHLDAAEFAGDRDAVYAQARAAGVTAMLVPAVAVSQFDAVRACCAQYPGCLAAYGIHPLYVMQASTDDLASLRRWIETERPVAVGEIGLDGAAAGIDRARQEMFFAEQLRMARDFDLPVILHVRRAVEGILGHIRRIGGRGIAHAFNGSQQQAEELIRRGFKLGFGGTLSYPGSTRIHALATHLPLESIVLETDAPDIPPVWRRTQRNTPDQLPRLAAELAHLRQIDPAALAESTWRAAAEAVSAIATIRPSDIHNHNHSTGAA